MFWGREGFWSWQKDQRTGRTEKLGIPGYALTPISRSPCFNNDYNTGNITVIVRMVKVKLKKTGPRGSSGTCQFRSTKRMLSHTQKQRSFPKKLLCVHKYIIHDLAVITWVHHGKAIKWNCIEYFKNHSNILFHNFYSLFPAQGCSLGEVGVGRIKLVCEDKKTNDTSDFQNQMCEQPSISNLCIRLCWRRGVSSIPKALPNQELSLADRDPHNCRRSPVCGEKLQGRRQGSEPPCRERSEERPEVRPEDAATCSIKEFVWPLSWVPGKGVS